MSKLKIHHRPNAEIRRRERDEFRLCKGEKCRNVIALWTKEVFCSRCRGRKAR